MITMDPSFQSRLENAVRGIDFMMDSFGLSMDDALQRVPIAEDLLPYVREEFERRKTVRIIDPSALVKPHQEWLSDASRDHWYYWPRLRSYLLGGKKWPGPVVRNIDRATEKILGAMENPTGRQDFETRGLVVGYVQSGKTANYSALIAKAADAGYRLFIVLSGIHDTLRLQTQRRLDAELVGKVLGKWGGVGRPASNKEWITLTRERDFDPGAVGTAALGLEKPGLMVVKKNARVLDRVIEWLDDLPDEVRKTLPCLVIDDEADQASINTGGNRPEDVDEGEEDADESPTRINLCIRRLLNRFSRTAYVAYTATPYANVLIEHNGMDREGKKDLYPSSFIVSLPRPDGYYGAEQIFGTPDGSKLGMDIVRIVPDDEVQCLVPAKRNEIATFSPEITPSLRQAIDDFVLGGAARIHRGNRDKPATMLIHTSYSTIVQNLLTRQIANYVDQLSNDWLYSKQRKETIAKRLNARWENDFRRVSRSVNPTLDVAFGEIETHIATFLKDLPVLQINTVSPDQLDYERDPDLKVIVVGGNRLSRGLTLEGLLVSFYVRKSSTYDTLMQMGRWFGFRDGYADLTRIYTTKTLRDWFRDLAGIEEELRDEIARYEREGTTPMEMGTKIRSHPSMMVTSPLKMKAADVIQISFAGQVAQTITFPLNDHAWLHRNIEVTREFTSRLGSPEAVSNHPVWHDVPAIEILWFLEHYQMDREAKRIQPDTLRKYIAEQNTFGELKSWTVGVMGREKTDSVLGTLDLGVPGIPAVNLIGRTRLENGSLGVIVSPPHEGLGLTNEQLAKAKLLRVQSTDKISEGRALRACRDRKQGLLLIYPISRNAGHNGDDLKGREPLFPRRDVGEHVIGVAISFPDSKTAASVEYVVGSAGPGSA